MAGNDKALRVADYEQSGVIRSEARQLFQKYILAVLGYLGSAVWFYVKINNSLGDYDSLCVAIILVSFIVYCVLVKSINLYTEQIQIATHHIRNQQSHRKAFSDENLLGLQGVRLFSRSMSLTGVIKYFIPHWTTRTEFSLVAAMLMASFAPIGISFLYWEKLGYKGYVVFFLIEVACALIFLNRNIMDIYSYLVASRVTTPDNPVPVMKKTQLVPLPLSNNIRDSFSRNRELFCRTALSLLILCGLLFAQWGDKRLHLVLKIVFAVVPYCVIALYAVAFSRYLFGKTAYRKLGVSVHAVYLLLVLLYGTILFFCLSPLIDKFPLLFSYTNGEFIIKHDRLWLLWMFLLNIAFLFLMQNGSSIYTHGKQISVLLSLGAVLIISLIFVYAHGTKSPVNNDSNISSYQHARTLSTMENVKTWKTRLNKGIDDEYKNISNDIGRKIVAVGMSSIYIFYLLWLYYVDFKKRNAGFSWYSYIALFGLTSVVLISLSLINSIGWSLWCALIPFLFCAVVIQILRRYYLREIGEVFVRVPRFLTTAGIVLFAISISILVACYRAELYLSLLICGCVLILIFSIRKESVKKGRLPAMGKGLLTICGIYICFFIMMACNELTSDNVNDVGSFAIEFIRKMNWYNESLHTTFTTGHVATWPLTFYGMNIVVLGLLFVYSFFKFLVAVSERYEYHSLAKVIGGNDDTSTWPKGSWRAGWPKKIVFLYLECAIIIFAVAFSGQPVASAIAICLLMYLVISEFMFEVELYHCGSWYTEFCGMHLLADNYINYEKSNRSFVDHMKEHGISERFTQAFLDKQDDEKDEKRQVRVAMRHSIDKSYHTLLKKRMNAIFSIDHSTKFYRRFRDNQRLNSDNLVLARSLRLLNRSSIITPLRAFFLLPWEKDLIYIYDTLGQPGKIWNNRASQLTNTPVHSSLISEDTPSGEFRMLLSSANQAGERQLAAVARCIHKSFVKGQNIIERMLTKIEEFEKAYVATRHREALKHDAINRILAWQEEISGSDIEIGVHRVLEDALRYLRDDDFVSLKSVLRRYKKSNIVFIGNFGSKFYDSVGIPYIHGFNNRESTKSKVNLMHFFSLFNTHYHPKTIMRIKPDHILMCGTSYYNINMAKFAKKINPKIGITYLSPPHVEVTSHINDRRLLEMVDSSDMVYTCTREQDEEYTSYFSELARTPQQGGVYNYTPYGERHAYAGYPLPRFVMQWLAVGSRLPTEVLKEKLEELAYRSDDKILIYSGSDETAWQHSFPLAMYVYTRQQAELENATVVFMLPDVAAYYSFRDYAGMYLKEHFGDSTVLDRPLNFESFKVCTLRYVYRDDGTLCPPEYLKREGDPDSNDTAVPVETSRIFGEVYPIGLHTVARSFSCVLGFNDPLMNLIALFLPAIDVSYFSCKKLFANSISSATVKDPLNAANVRPLNSNVDLSHRGIAPAEIPTLMIPWLMRRNRIPNCDNYSKSFAFSWFSGDKEEIYGALCEELNQLRRVEKDEFIAIQSQIITQSLLRYDNSMVREYYSGIAKDILKKCAVLKDRA